MRALHPGRWLTPEYQYMRNRLGMTPAQAVCRARSLRALLAPVVGLDTVRVYALDNPYRSLDALKVILNEVERERYVAPEFRRRPVVKAPAAKMGSRKAVA